jgi:hypothetical protein
MSAAATPSRTPTPQPLPNYRRQSVHGHSVYQQSADDIKSAGQHSLLGARPQRGRILIVHAAAVAPAAYR